MIRNNPNVGCIISSIILGPLRTCFRKNASTEAIEVNDNKMVVSASLNLIGESDMTAYRQDTNGHTGGKIQKKNPQKLVQFSITKKPFTSIKPQIKEFQKKKCQCAD